MVLSFPFRGYVEPLIVMLAIPLAFIGAIWGNVLMGYYLSMVPLLADTSSQADAIKPLVISVAFGLLSATLLVLLVIPALYVLLDDLGFARCPLSAQVANPAGPPDR